MTIASIQQRTEHAVRRRADALERGLSATADGTEWETPAELSRALLEVVVPAVGADGGALVLMHPHTGLFWSGSVVNLHPEGCSPFLTNEVAGASPLTFARMIATGAGAKAIRLRSGSDDSILTDVLGPLGYHDELRTVCRDAGLPWAGLSLWRREGEYAPGDEAVLQLVSPTLAVLLRDLVLRSLQVGAHQDGRAVLLVEDGRLTDISEAGQTYLAGYTDTGTGNSRHLDQLLVLARTTPRFSTVFPTDDGHWVSAHGTELGSGRVAITLTSASPLELFGTRVAGAGLSGREVEVTRLICLGLTDGEIARELSISPHTARDHAKAIRRKLGVRSRGEVAALVFAEHYRDTFVTSTAVSHAG